MVAENMDIDEVLIEEVRSHTILYDLGHRDYKNLRKKELVWREVAANIKLSETECKKRWKGLRDLYKRCRKMEQLPFGSAAEPPKKRWRYYDAMAFLENVSSSRQTIGNIYEEEEIVEEPDLESINYITSPDLESSTTSLRRRKRTDSDKFREFLDFAAASISETCGAATQNQNSTALHFASLAAKIQEANMPPSLVNRIEAKVSNIVFKEIEQFYNDSKEI